MSMLFKSVVVAAVVLTTLTVGCAAEREQGEEHANTESAVTRSSGDAASLLTRLEDRINNCHRLTDAERAALGSLSPGFSFSAQVYVYVACKVESGRVVSTSATVERRAGWSSNDGSFEEVSMTAQTSINIPIRVVTASGSVAHEQTLRTSGGITYSGESTSVGVGVERNFGLARASVSADFNGTSASITGGLQSPVDIPIAACGAGATGSFGVRVSLTASRNASEIPRALRDRIERLTFQNQDNDWVRSQVHETDREEERRLCCNAQHTCD